MTNVSRWVHFENCDDRSAGWIAVISFRLGSAVGVFDVAPALLSRLFLKEHEAGLKMMADLCGKRGISEASFYNWKVKYGGLSLVPSSHKKSRCFT
jgi:hypothetical protein